MRLLLVRHGQSEWNASRRLQGQADIRLSELGRAQADRLRPVIEAIGPCRAVASDLVRASETAARLGANDARLTAGLREIDVGAWTGRTIADIVAEDEAAYLDWRAGAGTPPGGESWPAFVERTAGVIESERRTTCANLLVVCHGGVIRALLEHLLRLAPIHIIPVGPASLTAVRLEEDRPARLELFNYRPDRLDLSAPD